MSSLNDSRNWNFNDPIPEGPLVEIKPLSLRATALLRRSRSPLLHAHFIQIAGAVSMMSGMEYHFCRFMDVIPRHRGSPFPLPDLTAARHEAVAWINRVGQFHAFKTSDLVSRHIRSLPTPTLDVVLRFRNKHTAHRSIDKPKREDDEDLQISQAMCLSEIGGTLWQRRPEVVASEVILPTHSTHLLCFQMAVDGAHHDLIIEQEHESAMSESYEVIQALLGGSNDV